MKPRVLVVDDEASVLVTLRAVLELAGYDVESAASAREGESRLWSSTAFEIVVTDLRMETANAGYDVVRAAKALSPAPRALILTAYPPTEEQWKATGADFMLEKPADPAHLLEIVKSLLEGRRVRRPAAAAGAAGSQPGVGA